MADHTPTPWAYRGGPISDEDQREFASISAKDIGDVAYLSLTDRPLANAAFIVRAVNSHSELTDCLIEFLEPYHDQDCPTLFAKLPGTEAQRVVRARKILKTLGIDTTSFDQVEAA